MELKLNREYAMRHLFVVALMVGLCGWFGYDGFVRYPATPAHDLYVAIEKAEPQEGLDLEAFKAQKTKSQKGFAALALIAAVFVGSGLLTSLRFRFAFDDDGFTVGSERHGWNEIKSLDDAAWAKKGITRAVLECRTITLDAWHHTGVKEFHEKAILAIDKRAEI